MTAHGDTWRKFIPAPADAEQPFYIGYPGSHREFTLSGLREWIAQLWLDGSASLERRTYTITTKKPD